MPGKPYMSKYGKKHDRLRSRAKTLDEKSMDPNNPVSDNKFNRLQNRATAKRDKAREIRNKADESANMMKPYQHNHANMMKGQTMAPSPDMMKPYQANHPNMMKPAYKAKHANMMKPPYAMVHPIMKHMSHNK